MLAVAAVLGLAAALRLLSIRLGSANLGVDHWYWKAWVETYRRERRFPPELPQYVLDEQQWYPPVFPLLLAHLPAVVFEGCTRLLAIGVDLLRLGLLLGATAWLSGGDMAAVMVAGLVYALAPILVSYNVQLNPRGLGALLLDGGIILVLWAYALDGPAWAWLIAALLGGVVLLTHKMTTQLLWFLCLAAASLTLDWRFAALIPASVLVALVLSRGFYAKVAIAHWDIVTFWNRNWRWLQAHPLKESPVYGEPGYETPTKLHRRGLPGVAQHVRYLAGYLPAGWIMAALLALGTLRPSVPAEVALAVWAGLVLAFAAATTLVPFLKCLGSGGYYLYNAAFPVALLWGLTLPNAPAGWVAWAGLGVAVLVSLVALARFYRRVAQARAADAGLDEALAYLREQPKGVVMCLPMNLYDLVAYKTGQPVLFGAHGYGFRRVEPVFPRLLVTLAEARERYGVRYLLARKDYLVPCFLGELAPKPACDRGAYAVFHLR
jgi:hypothetical protein